MTDPKDPEAVEIATLILRGFADYRRRFRRITTGARRRFELADWGAVQTASTARIQLYRECVDELVAAFAVMPPIPLASWTGIKHEYETLIVTRNDYDLAETVFNTVFRKVMTGARLTDQHAFVTESVREPPAFTAELTNHFGPGTGLGDLLEEVLESFHFDLPYLDRDQDIEMMTTVMKASIPLLRGPAQISFDMLKPVFFRNKGAYLIGRMFLGDHLFPIAIPIQNRGSGLYVDTIIWNDDDLSIIFSFTRSYFMVDTPYPAEMISYLQELLPNKKRWELFTAVGFYKHGKTEFYRGFLAHLAESDDQFVIARGIRGLVMSVFTLPSYQTVFKVIRDKFSPSKKVTREQVRDAYYLVKTHDRVGRMADTQEFSDFVFPRARFSGALIEELQKACASSLTLTDEHVILSHLYTERLMTPLNLYLETAGDFERAQVLEEYGNAIKQLAAANIFPGDMLLKNFGVTRHRRVVFYDYDEICYLTEVNFRKIPPPRDGADRMAAEPWYSVGPMDVFPEEFEKFLFNSPVLMGLFKEDHADLFTPEYWQDLQDRIRQNQVMDVYPYRRKRRFLRSGFTGSQPEDRRVP